MLEIAVLVTRKSALEQHFNSFAQCICSEESQSEQSGSDHSDRRVKYALTQISIEELLTQENILSVYRALIVPGGSVFEVEKALGVEGSKRICEFVHSGGGYIGCCCGAFLASRCGYMSPLGEDTSAGFAILGVQSDGYFGGTGDLTCDILAEKTTSFSGQVQLSFLGTKSSSMTDKESTSTVRMFYRNGQLFSKPCVRKNTHLDCDVPVCTPLLRASELKTATDHHKFADGVNVPGAVYYGAVAGRFGKGRVVAFGGHPESRSHHSSEGHASQKMVRDALDWVVQGEAAPIDSH